jgi:outer membrane lipase/esterase
MMPNPFLIVKTFALVAVMVSLAACGAGSVKDPFIPTRVVVLGDALSDMTSATTRYTVNDATINNWAEQVASSYGLTAANIMPLAAGNASVAAVSAQASGFAFQSGDLVLMSAGYRDLIDVAEAAGTQAASVASATALGTAYANAVRGIVNAGAQHVIALDMYNLAQTPYQTLGARTAATHPLNLMTRAFNDALKSNLGDLTRPYIGDNIRLGRAELYIGNVVLSPTGNGFADATTVTCISTGNIGIVGSNLSSLGCTTSTLNPAIVAPQTYNSYVFADPVYLTPAAHRGLGNFVRSGVNW